MLTGDPCDDRPRLNEQTPPFGGVPCGGRSWRLCRSRGRKTLLPIVAFQVTSAFVD